MLFSVKRLKWQVNLHIQVMGSLKLEYVNVYRFLEQNNNMLVVYGMWSVTMYKIAFSD